MKIMMSLQRRFSLQALLFLCVVVAGGGLLGADGGAAAAGTTQSSTTSTTTTATSVVAPNNDQLADSMNAISDESIAALLNTTDQDPDQEFTETEIERLCPSGELEVLKSVPHGKPCTHGDHEFWHLTCRCHYLKGRLLPCPTCPDEYIMTSSTQQPQPAAPLGVGWPYFVMSVPQHNYSVLYQMPDGSGSSGNGNGSSSNPGFGSRLSIYNSAGGVVSLYFYQLANPATAAGTAAAAGGGGASAGGGGGNSTHRVNSTAVLEVGGTGGGAQIHPPKLVKG